MQEFTNNLSPKVVKEENGECVKYSYLTFICLDIFGKLIAKYWCPLKLFITKEISFNR